MWPDWLRHGEESDEDTGDNSDTQRRKRRTGERSVFDRFIGEAAIDIIIMIMINLVVIAWPTLTCTYSIIQGYVPMVVVVIFVQFSCIASLLI